MLLIELQKGRKEPIAHRLSQFLELLEGSRDVVSELVEVFLHHQHHVVYVPVVNVGLVIDVPEGCRHFIQDHSVRHQVPLLQEAVLE